MTWTCRPTLILSLHSKFLAPQRNRPLKDWECIKRFITCYLIHLMLFPFGVILIAGVLIARKFHKQMQIHKHSLIRSDFFYHLDSPNKSCDWMQIHTAAFKIHTLCLCSFWILYHIQYVIHKCIRYKLDQQQQPLHEWKYMQLFEIKHLLCEASFSTGWSFSDLKTTSFLWSPLTASLNPLKVWKGSSSPQFYFSRNDHEMRWELRLKFSTREVEEVLSFSQQSR